jgi:DNA-binding MarR family transcriptional regulator
MLPRDCARPRPDEYAVYLNSLSLQFTCISASVPAMTPAPRRKPAVTTSVLVQDLRAVLGRLRRKLREQAGSDDLTPSQMSVLKRLEADGAATASALARAEGMRPQSIVPVIAALDEAGLVAGAPDPEDGRQTLLSLTPRCRSWLAQSRAARQDWLTRTLEARLTPAEMERLADAVELLKRVADD